MKKYPILKASHLTKLGRRLNFKGKNLCVYVLMEFSNCQKFNFKTKFILFEFANNILLFLDIFICLLM